MLDTFILFHFHLYYIEDLRPHEEDEEKVKERKMKRNESISNKNLEILLG